MLPVSSVAQQNESEDDLLETLEKFFKQDYLSLGVLLDTRGEFHYEPSTPGQNTLRVPNARLKVSGELDNNFGYVLQMDVTGSPALLDAIISYRFSDSFSLQTGAMKPLLGGEFRLSPVQIDFINRSRIVSVLAQKRDIGVVANAVLTEGLTLSGGVYNGTSPNVGNNNNEFYFNARMEANSEIGRDARLQIALNGAYGEENGTSIGNGMLPTINGSRLIYGGDFRVEYSRFMLSGEFLGAQLEYGPGTEDDILGFHITGGVNATDDLQFLVRLDHIESSNLPEAVFPLPVDLILGAIDYRFTESARFRLNYQVNPEVLDINNQVLLAQMQLYF